MEFPESEPLLSKAESFATYEMTATSDPSAKDVTKIFWDQVYRRAAYTHHNSQPIFTSFFG